MRILPFPILVLAIILTACGGQEEPESQPKEPEIQSGFELSNFDTTVSPAQDFNEYVNGNWIKNNPVPASKSRWTAFNEVVERNNKILHEILEECSKKEAEKGSHIQQIRDFYNVAMDSAKLEQEGLAPLKPYLDKVAAIENEDDLLKVLNELHRLGLGTYFQFGYSPDLKNRDKKIGDVSPGRTGLPNRNYYLGKGEKYDNYRSAYKSHVNNMLTICEIENGEQIADDIFNMEYKLSEATMPPEMKRNPDNIYNKMDYGSFKALAPDVNWDLYMEATGAGLPDTVIVTDLNYIKTLNKVLTSTDLQTHKNYLTWFVIAHSSNFLNEALSQEHFNFYGTVLQGRKSRDPRWKRVVGIMNKQLGEVLGKEYVKKAFSESSKERVNTMIDNLQLVFRERLGKLNWMSDETKKRALEKLDAFNRKIGYPDKWQDYSKMDIGTDSYLENYFNTNRFEYNKMIAERNDPLDKTRWGMPPQKVNAYYNPILNEIVFPAAILQNPFFMPDADEAINYGAIGAVIGHEFLHGFDDQGSKFSAKGKFENWWSEQDREQFNGRTDKLVYQFGQFRVLDSLPVNGQLTLGENIADLGGLTMAYYALQKHLEKAGRDTIDGFSPEQRFFIGWAQVWRANYTDDALRMQVLTDPHSPSKYRINGPLSNMPEFYEAFHIKPGAPMCSPDSLRVKIW